MARVVSPAGISSAPATRLTDFYRQEFLKHRNVWRRNANTSRSAPSQRRPGAAPRSSVSSTALRAGRCRPVDEPAASKVQRRDRPVRLARPHAASLTVPLATVLRDDLQRILARRSRGHRADFVARCGATGTRGVFELHRRIARGRGRRRQGGVADGAAFSARAPVCGRSRHRAGPRVGAAPLPDGFEWFPAGHPDPNAASVAAGRRALELARSTSRRSGAGRAPLGRRVRPARRSGCPASRSRTRWRRRRR